MNERIQLLAEEAIKDMSGSFDIWYMPKPNEFINKFAELIVRECSAFLNGAVEVYTQAEQDACNRAAKGLKNYFGVEE